MAGKYFSAIICCIKTMKRHVKVLYAHFALYVRALCIDVSEILSHLSSHHHGWQSGKEEIKKKILSQTDNKCQGNLLRGIWESLDFSWIVYAIILNLDPMAHFSRCSGKQGTNLVPTCHKSKNEIHLRFPVHSPGTKQQNWWVHMEMQREQHSRDVN